MRFVVVCVCVVGLVAALAGAQPAAQRAPQRGGWLQWGGPTRNFVVEGARLADAWPTDGPRRLWSRPLGDGHSSSVVDEGRLFTQYRPAPPEGQRWADEEIVVALNEASGETLWEYRYPSRPLDFQFGAGPYATPLVVGDRLFTAGTNKQIFAFDKRTGKVLWSHDLVKEYGSPPALIRPAVKAGYSCSPLAYRDTVIVPAGGAGQAVMAFRQADGALVWKSGDFYIAQASPILIDLDGSPQLVVFGGQDVNGLDPATGTILWTHSHDTQGDMNISTPVWSTGSLLFLSSAYNGGARMLRLARQGDRTKVEEVWFSRRLRVHFGTVIRVGDLVVGSSGDFGPAFLTALEVGTGELIWQERQFARANFLYADGKLVILDEDGVLGLARVSREGLQVLARASVLASRAWTVPTLVGDHLYVRDRKTIAKLAVGPDARTAR